MRVLILGSGGREHALAWAIAKSPQLTQLFAAPGNGGIADLAECVSLAIEDGAAVVQWARNNAIDFVIVGPEAPLAAGVADALTDAGITVFGPSAAAAQLEASKAFTHAICDACNAPMAKYGRFTDADSAKAYIRSEGAPIVVKADGLAAGKGVVVAETADQACDAVEMMLSGGFGEAGAEVVIEEFMEGEEASFFVLSDGETVLSLASAQDHKRVGEGDTGPNTGGMGAYSPAPVMTAQVETRVMDRIIRPVIAEMAARGTPFRGVLYAGLMIKDGEPRLVEFNVRFGDPECQVLMLRLARDFLPVLHACATGRLADVKLDWNEDPAITVVMAAKGYPGSYEKGSVIRGLEAVAGTAGVTIFHAGTQKNGDEISASGGRVLNVSATGATVTEARNRAYAAIDRIDWPDGFCRTDIAWRVLGRD
ncbi:MAG: phosphoribosylamine--glycine ligase [Pseudomonadota bacterium]